MDLLLLVMKKNKLSKWGQHLFVASVYHPYDETYNDFNTQLDATLSKIESKFDIIMGGDMNAQVGIRQDGDEYNDVLGPFGLSHRNEKGRDLLQVYQSNNLRIMNTTKSKKKKEKERSYTCQVRECA